jgi:hypothetical protein
LEVAQVQFARNQGAFPSATWERGSLVTQNLRTLVLRLNVFVE